MQFNISGWLTKKNKDEIVLVHSGAMTANLITNLLAKLEAEMERLKASSKVWKRVYNVAVETLQNLFHHADNTPNESTDEFGNQFAVFVVIREGKMFKLTTGNFVHISQEKKLKDRVDQINFLTKIELKALYKLILNNQEFSEKGGGGLGMIDIARRSGNKLEYDFNDYNEEYKFFTLEILV